MKKLLRKLFLYLFKEDFQRMKALERDLKGLIHRQKCATSLAENFGCDYLDVTEFTNMELPEPLFKVIRLSDGEVVKDKDGNPL